MSRKLLSVIYSFLDCIPITQINSLKDCPFWAFFWNSNHAPTPFLTSPSSYVSNVCVPCCFIWLVHVLPKHSSSYSLPHKHLLQELLTSCTGDHTSTPSPVSVDLPLRFLDLSLCHNLLFWECTRKWWLSCPDVGNELLLWISILQHWEISPIRCEWLLIIVRRNGISVCDLQLPSTLYCWQACNNQVSIILH